MRWGGVGLDQGCLAPLRGKENMLKAGVGQVGGIFPSLD
jgi:hypothetical protein